MDLSAHRSPAFSLDLHHDQPPAEVWRRLWDLQRHTDSIPLTTVWSQDGQPLHPGSRFVGRTGVGRLRLDDRMEVREWQPPHRAEIVKVGPMLRGRISVTVEQDGTGSRLHWHQWYGSRGVPDAIAAALAPLVRAGYRTSLRRILG